jgi:hypothetical protein
VDQFAPPGGFDDRFHRYQRTGYPETPGTSADAWTSDSSACDPGEANDVPLPVELTAFTAATDGGTVWLRWATASETNNSGFAVEMRSADFGALNGSQRDASAWREVGFVEGAGTTTEARRYDYAVRGLGASRYVFRLKQVDYDGTLAYSPEVEVLVGAEAALSVSRPYPNPAAHSAYVDLVLREGGAASVRLYDALGRALGPALAETLRPGEPRRIALDLTALAPGVYFVTATSGEARRTQVLVVK